MHLWNSRAVLAAMAIVALAGCGTPGRIEGFAPVTTPPVASNQATTTTTAQESAPMEAQVAGSTTTQPPTTGPELIEEEVADLEPTLDQLDEVLAELDNLLTQAASALDAEEGEFLP